MPKSSPLPLVDRNVDRDVDRIEKLADAYGGLNTIDDAETLWRMPEQLWPTEMAAEIEAVDAAHAADTRTLVMRPGGQDVKACDVPMSEMARHRIATARLLGLASDFAVGTLMCPMAAPLWSAKTLRLTATPDAVLLPSMMAAATMQLAETGRVRWAPILAG